MPLSRPRQITLGSGRGRNVPFGNEVREGGVIAMPIRTLVAVSALLLAAGGVHADEFDKLPSASILPKGTVKVSGVVPGMGEHWANPKDLPLGPIYCVHKGKVVCLEFMISQADF